ncbi:hypothetical protein ACFQ0T_30960 [Kitasatospora gansuensis]
MERDPVLGGLFEDAVHRIDVPVGELVAGSMRLGRRQRLHRRLRIAGTSLVVAALATTGAATQWSSGEGDARRTVASGATSVFPERPPHRRANRSPRRRCCRFWWRCCPPAGN